MKQTPVPEVYDDYYFLSKCSGYEHFATGNLAEKYAYAEKLAGLEKNSLILDIGCGRGELAVELVKRHYVFGIDYSKYALKTAKILAKKRKSKAVFKRMNCKKLDFKDNFFEAVFMLDIAEHLSKKDLAESIAEAKRVLKPGGKLIIHTAPNSAIIKPAYFFTELLRKEWESRKYHINEQSFFSLRKNLVGFSKVELKIEKDKKFFSRQLGNNGLLLKVAKLIDFLNDNQIFYPVLSRKPANILFGTNLWAKAIK